jgi:hypothetical protein
MENFLINYLLKNCVTLAKEFFSSEKAAVKEGNNAVNFHNLLDAKMGSSAMTTNTGTVDGALSKEGETETSVGNGAKKADPGDPSINFFDTQSILASLQTYFKTQDTQDNTPNIVENKTQSVTIEKLLQNVFSLLQDGESVQFFLKGKSIDAISSAQTSKEEETMAETDQHPADEPAKVIDNSALIAYLASILQESDVSKETGKKTEDAGAENKDKSVNGYEKFQGIEASRIFRTTIASKETIKVTHGIEKSLLNKTEVPPSFEDENSGYKDVANPTDVAVKPFPSIEVKKLNERENVIQVISNESSPRENREMNKNISILTAKVEKPSVSNDSSFKEFVSGQPLSGENGEAAKNISVLTVKTEKATLSRDDEIVGVVSKVNDKVADEHAGLDERQLLSQSDYTKTSMPPDKETGKVLQKTAFVSVMADRIEKIVEQYANKNVSMDMVVRLKIDEKETLLVGLKEQGQRVTVEVKTTNENMGTFLQSQKEEIARQLQGKNIYANIYVDVQNQNPQKRDQRNNQKKRTAEQEKQDFSGFLDAVA